MGDFQVAYYLTLCVHLNASNFQVYLGPGLKGELLYICAYSVILNISLLSILPFIPGPGLLLTSLAIRIAEDNSSVFIFTSSFRLDAYHCFW